jgi:hypothetical protein
MFMRMSSMRYLGVAAIAASLVASACAQTTPATPQVNFGPYVPTPTVIVTELLKLADLKPGEFIIDLGSGDGRIVTTAAKQYGARGFGIEIQPQLVDQANANARAEGVGDRVKFIRQDLFLADIREANVITLYLLPSTVTKLVPKFMNDLKPGTRIISHDYPLAPWDPDRVEEFSFEEKIRISGTTRTVLYRYIVPARIAGTWDARLPTAVGKAGRLVFTQEPNLNVKGTAEIDGRSVTLDDVRLRGDALTFNLPPVGASRQRVAMKARVADGAMQVSGEGVGNWTATLRK